MAIDYGDWRNLPDYRDGWVDKHKSGIGGMLASMDVGSYIPGLNVLHNAVNNATTDNLTGANTVLSPIVKGINQGLDYIDPLAKAIKKNTYAGEINDFVENKPADALAVVAATYFSGGALSGAATGGGAGASTGIGAGATTAGSAAITPTFASGAGATAAGTTAAAGAGAITPAFASSGLSIAPAAVSGGLGAAGTAAANSLLTPAFASFGGASGGGLISGLKNAYNKFNSVDKYRGNIDRFAKNQPNERDRMNAQAGALADKILNDQSNDYRSKVANQLMINRFGMRK